MIMATNEKKKRIGILGGTFDPIHYGHLIIAQLALESCQLDYLYFVPAGEPPHKKKNAVTSTVHRMQMVEMAIADHHQFQLCDYEVKREKPSYTVHLLTYFQQQHPEGDLYLIMGADSLMELETWYHYEELFPLATIIVMKRDGAPDLILEEKARHFIQHHGARITLAPSLRIDLSSSAIRQRVAQGKSIRCLTPEQVREYIDTHQLYRSR